MRDLKQYFITKKEEAQYRLEKYQNNAEENFDEIEVSSMHTKLTYLIRESQIVKDYLTKQLLLLENERPVMYTGFDVLNYLKNRKLELEENHKFLLEQVELFLDQRSHNKKIAQELIEKQRDNIFLLDFISECERELYTDYLIQIALQSGVLA